ncbi:hypothetical protein OC842_006663 [Tilletia horrida]|uniref:Uncharacterized protein n=1 Tax=Tilletia horrida TaxID=155126 RepID=A0AAN6G6U4_9BASI|nr:hypothetical protein OC842_006663 [Tilletia horrida]KAK0567444.1 hypothetical protein OC844_000242 [Tilletia horrida]
MRTTFAFATIAAALLGSATAYPLNGIECTGEEIVGNLVVRNPDGSTHVAAFVQGDSDTQGRLKLTTKFDGVPSPQYAQFAAQICTSGEYIYGKRGKRQAQQQDTLNGFISPNYHRNKALTVGAQTAGGGAGEPRSFSLVSEVKADQKFTDTSLKQWFTLYNNGTFYSLAYAGREGGNTAAFGYSPVSRHDGDDIFVEMQDVETSQLGDFVNYYGYALELHP